MSLAACAYKYRAPTRVAKRMHAISANAIELHLVPTLFNCVYHCWACEAVVPECVMYRQF
jgi:hypothetical protein